MSDQEDVVIFDSSLTLHQLKGYWSYMREEDETPKFTDEEINKLGTDIEDAIQGIIEDFLNYRDDN